MGGGSDIDRSDWMAEAAMDVNPGAAHATCATVMSASGQVDRRPSPAGAGFSGI